jgi:hypothetical protein
MELEDRSPRNNDVDPSSEVTPLVEEAAPDVRQNIPSSSPSMPPPTLWASRLSLFLARRIPGYGVGGSLELAWSYFEYLVLPRRVALAESSFGQRPRSVKAPPGYHGHVTGRLATTLYPAWTTHVRDLTDFGTGVAVYFETLLALSVVCLIAGLLYLPSIQYYASDGYTTQHITTVLGPLRGSMICPQPVWVLCEDCPASEWKVSPGRYATTATATPLVFALKNTCATLRWQEGLNHAVVCLFITVSMLALGRYQRKLERRYDESVLTASDFSIQVDNPPADATDPADWQTFFAQFGQVVYVTVALDNAPLLRKLVQRRTILLQAHPHLMNTTSSSTANSHHRLCQSLPRAWQSQRPTLYRKWTKIEAECRSLIQSTGHYPATTIFVTFDKEADQRKCLQALQVGQIHVVQNNVHALSSASHRFRGTHVLRVLEPTEPSAIRWQDLDESIMTKIRECIISTLLSVGVTVAGFTLVSHAYNVDDDVGTAALYITLLNIVMPNVFKAINNLESHQYEDSFQASLYKKLTLFRWVNTALATILIKPFPETLADTKGSLIASIHAVLRAEILIAPVVRILDIGGFVKRFVLAPRAPDQVTMNSFFHGAKVNLGEKYTNVTKTIFLVFFYAAIFPAGFFYGAVALFLTYLTDKFLLLRSWGPMPRVGDEVARLSRKVFFPTTVVVLAIMSEIFFSAYPCDNLCPTDRYISTSLVGSHTVTTLDGTTTALSVSNGDTVYRFCDQNFLERLPAISNLLSKEKRDWMDGAQESLSFAFGVFAVIVIAVIIFINLHEDVQIARIEVLGGFVSFDYKLFDSNH